MPVRNIFIHELADPSVEQQLKERAGRTSLIDEQDVEPFGPEAVQRFKQALALDNLDRRGETPLLSLDEIRKYDVSLADALVRNGVDPDRSSEPITGYDLVNRAGFGGSESYQRLLRRRHELLHPPTTPVRTLGAVSAVLSTATAIVGALVGGPFTAGVVGGAAIFSSLVAVGILLNETKKDA